MQEIVDFLGIDNNNDMEVDPENNRPIPNGRNNQEGNRARLVAGAGNQQQNVIPNPVHDGSRAGGLVAAGVAGVANQQPNPIPQLRNDGNLGVAALNPAAPMEQHQVPAHAYIGNVQNQNSIPLPQGNIMNGNQGNQNLPNAMQAFVPRPAVLQNLNANQARRGRNYNARSTPYDPHSARMRRRNFNNLAQLLMSMAKQGAYVPANHNDQLDPDENDAGEMP